MEKGQPFMGLPFTPGVLRLGIKISLGILCLTFFLNYQPTFGFPPIKKNIVIAQSEQSQTINAQKALYQLPHPGYLSTSFSTYHQGIDIATGLGMPIKPIAKGEVTEAGFNFWGLGLMVEVKHEDGHKSLYAHMGKIYVKKGQIVEMEDTLGEVGLTGHTSGPHTHLEISKEENKVNPVALLPTLREYPQEEDFKPVGGEYRPAPKPIQTPQPTPTPIPNLVENLIKDTSLPIQTKPISALDISKLRI